MVWYTLRTPYPLWEGKSELGTPNQKITLAMNELLPPRPPVGKLLTAEQIVETLFDPGARPTAKWLRRQARAKRFPSVSFGHLIFFDLETSRAFVRDSLSKTRRF